MNYIERLRLELAASRAAYEKLESGVHEFWVHVKTSPKYGHGRPELFDRDGLPLPPPEEPKERLDWIATADVANRLNAIVQAARDAADEINSGRGP
jgi:hypothetical protein